ncbi:M10 family metallopeptidase C-terminal domain-containing protein [Ruegeria sp.]|uniref:M10 family metallopeptidase C-terminal domain-containing protein n=1 Tax=Ruegeria sp. TaxID=1879320 RepID=UPI003B598FE0
MISYSPQPPSSSPVSAIQGAWAYGDGDPATTTTITYSFAQQPGTQAWTEAYRSDFRAALAAIESVANIRFVEVANPSSADLVEYIAPSSYFGSNTTLGYHYTPSSRPSEGAFNTDFWNAGANGDPGGFFFTTILHELGHALGLGHPHDDGLNTTVMQGVTSPFNSFGVGNLNQGVYTVMSYNDGWTSRDGFLPSSATFGGSTGLGALDIAALQAMYGANTTTNGGNNTYSLASSNAPGVGYQAIWDTGGIDTLRHTGSQNAVLDLRPATLDYSVRGGGGVSYAAGVKGGYTIAAGVVIENASGGSGNDTIFGNEAVNTLRGNDGNDTINSRSDGSNNNTIYGGNGHDTIRLAGGFGADTVYGGEGDDTAIIRNNSGSFFGGSGFDTASFIGATSGFLFSVVGGNYTFFNVVARITFTVGADVERFMFGDGEEQFDANQLIAATRIRDIEVTGTALQHAAQGIYLLDGATSNIAIVRNGAAVGESTYANWSAIQAEASGSDYRILWLNTNGQYSEWTVNGLGRFQSAADINNVVDVETFYNADLNNDGAIGHTTTAVESDGTTTLEDSTHGYYLLGGSVSLSRNGDDIGSSSYTNWKAVQAEADGAGYRMLWVSTNGQYSEWSVNSLGQFQSAAVIDNVVDVEVFYDADLNNDGTIGHTTTTLETEGTTTLGSSTHGYYLLGGSVSLSRNGDDIGSETYANWQAIQAEADGGGYRLLWVNTNGQYSEWTTNGQGQFLSSTNIGSVVDVEAFYNTDLNNDGAIGHTTTTIESDGTSTLEASTQGHYLLGGSVVLSLNGNDVGPDSYANWQAVQAEADGATGGYRVLWVNTNGKYSEWTVNSQGQFQSAANIDNVVDVEVFYDADLNNDGTTGHCTPSTILSGSDNLVVRF